jgi:hypothetical protein
MSSQRAGEFYEEATRGRSASHHLQVKAALALLYDVLGTTNPFAKCAAPKFSPEKIELRYHTASQLGQLVHELRQDRRQLLWASDILSRHRALLHRLPISRVGAAHHGRARA